jgi:hypothetical protein
MNTEEDKQQRFWRLIQEAAQRLISDLKRDFGDEWAHALAGLIAEIITDNFDPEDKSRFGQLMNIMLRARMDEDSMAIPQLIVALREPVEMVMDEETGELKPLQPPH